MSASGRYEIDENGRRCFRPAVPVFPEPADVADVLFDAVSNVHEFDRLVFEWPGTEDAGRLFARLDAVHSSAAEGSDTTFEELLEFEASRSAVDPAAPHAAVAACGDALDPGHPEDLIEACLTVHRRMFMGSSKETLSASAGEWKTRPNGTADPESPGGFFHYTQPSSVEAAMREWQAFTMDIDGRASEMVRQAASHWMFEHIHPVDDGNGRIGRLMVPLAMRTKGATKTSSAFFGEGVLNDKQLYLHGLESARISGTGRPGRA